MERVGTVESKTRTRTFSEGNFRGYTDYLIESEAGTRPAPQAFLVHQAPGWVLPVHFHLEEQFQVVVGGDGVLGKHDIAPLTVHYTSRDSGYGPLVAGAHGLDYLSLRAVTDPGAWYMPESREKMRRGLKKRQTTVGPIAVPASEVVSMDAMARVDVLLPLDESGLAAWLLVLPPGGRTQAPPQQVSGGRFHVVVCGSLVRSDQILGDNACIWRGADDAEMDVVAGSDGLSLLVLQFPAQALASEPLALDAA